MNGRLARLGLTEKPAPLTYPAFAPECRFCCLLSLTDKRRVNPAGAKKTRADENHPTYNCGKTQTD